MPQLVWTYFGQNYSMQFLHMPIPSLSHMQSKFHSRLKFSKVYFEPRNFTWREKVLKMNIESQLFVKIDFHDRNWPYWYDAKLLHQTPHFIMNFNFPWVNWKMANHLIKLLSLDPEIQNLSQMYLRNRNWVWHISYIKRLKP